MPTREASAGNPWRYRDLCLIGHLQGGDRGCHIGRLHRRIGMQPRCLDRRCENELARKAPRLANMVRRAAFREISDHRRRLGDDCLYIRNQQRLVRISNPTHGGTRARQHHADERGSSLWLWSPPAISWHPRLGKVASSNRGQSTHGGCPRRKTFLQPKIGS